MYALPKKISITAFIWMLLILPVFGSRMLAQNLVNNGDFEIYSSLPTTYGQSSLAVGWNNVNLNFTGPPYASPDYFHSQASFGNAFGQITPVSGNGQMGFCPFHQAISNGKFREYLASPLLTKMVPGQSYNVSFYLTNGVGGSYNVCINRIGMNFSVGPLTQLLDEPILLNPSVEISTVVCLPNVWKQYNFTFTALDTFKYVSIGNFRDNPNTTVGSGSGGAYYFIDKIEVKPVDGTGIADLAEQTLFEIYPNPSHGQIQITVRENIGENKFIFSLYNREGQLIFQGPLNSGNNELDLRSHKGGVYFYTISGNDFQLKKGKLLID